MPTTLYQSNSPCQKAAQHLLTLIFILIVAKLISWIPVMHHLQLAETFTAAEIIWFSAKFAALIIFFYFSRAAIEATPARAGIASFLRNIAEPITLLVIVIISQELLWHILTPFVKGSGETIYFSLAILAIISASIWLILKAYQATPYLFETQQNISTYFAQLIPSRHMLCTSCGESIQSNAAFCSYCGHKAQKQKSCITCGQMLSADEKYCAHCGTEANK